MMFHTAGQVIPQQIGVDGVVEMAVVIDVAVSNDTAVHMGQAGRDKDFFRILDIRDAGWLDGDAVPVKHLGPLQPMGRRVHDDKTGGGLDDILP